MGLKDIKSIRLPARAMAEAASIASSMGTLRPGFLLSGVMINILGLALPLAMLQIFDRIIPHAAFATLAMLVGGMLIALLCESVLRQVRSSIVAWEGARFDQRTSVALVRRILDAPLHEVEGQSVGIHMERLNSVEPVRDFYGQQVSLLLADLPFMLIFLGLIYYIAGILVLAPLALMVFYGALAWLTGNALHAAARDRRGLDGKRYSFIVEVLSSIHTAKGLAIERALQRRYERLIATGVGPGWRVNYLSSVSESFSNGFSQMTSIAVGGIGALLVINDQMSVGALAASTMLAGRSVQPVLRTLALWTRYQSIRLGVEHVKAVYAMPAEPNADKTGIDAIESIKLQDLSFRYGEDRPLLFDNVNLSVARGETIGLSGPNGCGKTTLLNLIIGGHAPTGGMLAVNDTAIETIARSSLRRHIAYIPQRAVLFKGTILDNLTRFDIDANLDQALDLAARLGLDRFFAGMPDGYDMEVGDGGTGGLPSGVIQRVGMVRALVGEPQLILFDEANSSLDQAGDKLVRDLIATYREKAAIMLVSFRPSLLAIADRRFVFEAGKIVPAPPVAGGTTTAKVAA